MWIRGLDHRVESMQPGLRDLSQSSSTSLCAKHLRLDEYTLDVAELQAPYSSQELILREALALPDDLEVNPSGGAMGANAPMVAGLVRIGEVASRIAEGRGDCGLGHATSGPCLQQNLVCVLEGE